MVRVRFRVEWPVSVFSCRGRLCDCLRTLSRARWQDRTRQEARADRAGASWRGRSVVRWMAQAPALPSGRKWNRSQPGQGTIELGFPRPALW